MDLQQAKDLQARFAMLYAGECGVIDGEKEPVELTRVTVSEHASAHYRMHFGYLAAQPAILVEWVPAGTFYRRLTTGASEEAGIDPTRIPKRKKWKTYPRVFEGLSVRYKRA